MLLGGCKLIKLNFDPFSVLFEADFTLSVMMSSICIRFTANKHVTNDTCTINNKKRTSMETENILGEVGRGGEKLFDYLI